MKNSRGQASIESPRAITFGLRGQASIELLVTLAFAMMMLIPILALAYIQTSSGSEQVAVDQAQQSVSRLKNVVDVVAAQGPPAKATVNIIVPQRLSSITVGSNTTPFIGREIIFRVRASGGETEIVATTMYNVTGNLTNYSRAGTYPVVAEALADCLGTGYSCVEIRPA